MTDSITVTGVVGSDPRVHVTTQGLAITSFRLASTRRYFDRAKGTWEDGETNWYTVSGFRQLAQQHRGLRPQGRSRRRPGSTPPPGLGERREVGHGDRDRGRLDRARPRLGHDDPHQGPTRECDRDRPTPPPRPRQGDGQGSRSSSERRRCRRRRRRARARRGHRRRAPTRPTSTTRSSRSPGEGSAARPPGRARSPPHRLGSGGRHRRNRGAMARRLGITAVLALAGAALIVGVTGCTAAPPPAPSATPSNAPTAPADTAPATEGAAPTLNPDLPASENLAFFDCREPRRRRGERLGGGP